MSGPGAPRRRALLVGVQEYKWDRIPPIPVVKHDLEMVRDALVPSGYEVKLLGDQHAPTRNEILDGIRGFLRAASSGETLQILFSGHGCHVGGKDYLIPYDVLSNDRIDEYCIRVDFGQELEECDAATVVFWVDACREGFHWETGDKAFIAAPWGTGERQRVQKQRRAIVFGCEPGQFCSFLGNPHGGGSGYSVFSKALATVLSVEHPARTFGEVREAVQRHSDEITRRAGKPRQKLQPSSAHLDEMRSVTLCEGKALTSPSELLQFLEILISTLPERLQVDLAELKAEATASGAVSLVEVVGTCCGLLGELRKAQMAQANEQRFTEAAWDLIAYLVRVEVEKRRGRGPVKGAINRGSQVIPVAATTRLFVTLLLAKRPDPRALLSAGQGDEPLSPFDHSSLARGIPFETGPASIDRILQFEQLLWCKILQDQGRKYTLGCEKRECVPIVCSLFACSRRRLYARLGADAAKGTPHHIFLNGGQNDQARGLVGKVGEIVFAEPDLGFTPGFDEGTLAVLINDFLKATSRTAASNPV